MSPECYQGAFQRVPLLRLLLTLQQNEAVMLAGL
jgi:hypothetical protein